MLNCKRKLKSWKLCLKNKRNQPKKENNHDFRNYKNYKTCRKREG